MVVAAASLSTMAAALCSSFAGLNVSSSSRSMAGQRLVAGRLGRGCPESSSTGCRPAGVACDVELPLIVPHFPATLRCCSGASPQCGGSGLRGGGQAELAEAAAHRREGAQQMGHEWMRWSGAFGLGGPPPPTACLVVPPALLLTRPPCLPPLAVSQSRQNNKSRKSEIATRIKKVGAAAFCSLLAARGRTLVSAAQRVALQHAAHHAAVVTHQWMRHVQHLPDLCRSLLACTASSSQVFVALDGFKASPPAAEVDLLPVQTLINQAYQGGWGMEAWACVCVICIGAEEWAFVVSICRARRALLSAWHAPAYPRRCSPCWHTDLCTPPTILQSCCSD